MEKIKNLDLWIISGIAVFLFIFGIFYYGILENVENPLAFIISIAIIFAALILLIVFSRKKKRQFKEVEHKSLSKTISLPKEKPKTFQRQTKPKTSSKKK